MTEAQKEANRKRARDAYRIKHGIPLDLPLYATNRRHLSDGDKADIVRRYESGEKVYSILRDYRVAISRVYAVLDQAGVSRRILTPKQESLRRVEMQRMRAGGATYQAIGERFNMSKQRAHQILTGGGE